MDTSNSARAQNFDDTVKAYLPHVYRYVLSIVHHKELAEDITQEAFIRAWQHIDQFDTSKPFKPWMLRIARNCAFDMLRKKPLISISQLSPHEQDKLQQIPDQQALPHEAAISHETKSNLQAVLATLKYDYQEIMTLHYNEELTNAEIAEVLNIPLETVRTRLRRAKAILRQTLHRQSEPSSSLKSVVVHRDIYAIPSFPKTNPT